MKLLPLAEANFADYESLTRAETGGKTGCYCAFWHQRFTSMEEWERRQREAPERNREAVLARVRGGFHVGALAYADSGLTAWISVGPVSEVYWAWRRVATLGEAARTTAGITCLNLAPRARGQGLQVEVLHALEAYGRAAGWTGLEGYPFDAEAHAQHGDKVAWPGTPAGFEAAGYTRLGPHWLTHPEWPRSIYTLAL